ncbi:sigma-70 family RNA polymerase sigma factor [Sinomicrobium kalidii]|uniref:RNA polymerase sigma factor n=1 Tax=Sinomicrobium kalidii TaxID=2900738 RepID=UPI001E298DE4|nr:sigma-70 family RNA polymerase sigma factor [Sinomicrobium kalidii]UGU14607.1 sigma-70 family RNA polymerase sigma factor [Sinomicrobium kalidii]
MNQQEKNSLIQRVTISEKGRLIHFLKQWIPDREDAKDIVQDVFYNLVLGFEDIKDMNKITSWLYSTARFKAIDFIRKKRATPASALSGFSDDDEHETGIFEWLQEHIPAHQETELWQEEVYRVLEYTLEMLPEEQRNAFVFHELEGIPVAEIARKQKVAVNTVLSRKRYAVKQLKKELQLLYNELND